MADRNRLIRVGETPYPHEAEGIAFAFAELDTMANCHARALVDLLDPSSSRLHEIDLLVIGYHALYLVELKHYTGRLDLSAHAI
jgi:hypothetical protein